MDTAAQTRSYDLRDLILFKSSLNLPFARYGVQDTYNLNGGNDSGYVLQMAQMDFKHIKFHFTSEF